jgi:PAS domain S-box-containing protein
MTGTTLQPSWLSDPRLSAHAVSPMPAWLWRADRPGILWSNPVGAAVFDAASPSILAQVEFEPHHVSAAQIARLAGTLPQGGAPRLERLRGFGARFGGTLTCLCSRITLDDNSAAILVVSTERAGKDLSLPDRARRILADVAKPAAMFSADGELIEATASAKEMLSANRDVMASDVMALGAEKLASEASKNGTAEGDIASGHVTMLKLGAGATFSLLAIFDAAPSRSHASARASDAAAAIAASAWPVPSAPLQTAPSASQRPRQFRFVWQMDSATRFTLGINDIASLIGPQTAAVLNRPWAEVAAALQLDNDGRIAKALASRETWSGLTVHWPVDGSSERLAVEMSGLPVFDRDRKFEGFRGFGICRDMTRVAAPGQPASPPTSPQLQPQPQANVLEFRAAPVTKPEPSPSLSPVEHSAFEELARELNARLKSAPAAQETAPVQADDFGLEAFVPPTSPLVAPSVEPLAEPTIAGRHRDAARETQEGRQILDRLPVGILVYRLSSLVYANRAFLDWTGYANLEALRDAGGLDSLFIETKTSPNDAGAAKNSTKTLTITTVNGSQKPVEGKLFSVSWNNENALVLMINTQVVSEERANTSENALRRLQDENHELRSILDTATDGVLVLDHAGHVLSANRSAEALFGYDAADFTEISFADLFAPESRRSVTDYLERLARGAAAGILETGRDAIGRVKRGGLVPLYVTVGRIEEGDKLCAVLRDVTAWKRTEEELINARQQAERASTAKSEFLAKISHEIRTPLNAIIGFSEVMIDERFGPVGNERYAQYLKDIHYSGGHLISLLNDLLDLSKIEAGKLELTFVSVNLNDLVQSCVAIMQEQANKERVIIRTSLPTNLPQIVADARSVRQIALNLLSNSIKFTGAGGQVIVSTAVGDDNEIVLRVRDTGVGMSEKELQTALEPFRQLATAARWGSTGTGLGLPITKALSEANHARFRITSQVDTGTLVEVAFPATRMLAQ